MTTTVIFPLSISNQEEENILKREELEESVTFEEDDESKGEDVRRE